PEDLLEPDWRERLAPHFNAMPQMHENKHIRSGRLNGVYFAHTLFLPEKMNASGNLVIVAKRVVYGGPNVEIIAPGRDVSIS
ncbi:MAG TPA: hypothetical protein VFQ92_11305, partial [Blastocatellia bacterium]|nr:hypothetical protein [Blastocatellia bacterium]